MLQNGYFLYALVTFLDDAIQQIVIRIFIITQQFKKKQKQRHKLMSEVLAWHRQCPYETGSLIDNFKPRASP